MRGVSLLNVGASVVVWLGCFIVGAQMSEGHEPFRLGGISLRGSLVWCAIIGVSVTGSSLSVHIIGSSAGIQLNLKHFFDGTCTAVGNLDLSGTLAEALSNG